MWELPLKAKGFVLRYFSGSRGQSLGLIVTGEPLKE